MRLIRPTLIPIATIAAILISTCSIARGQGDGAKKNPQRPNVLFIAIDDLNHWVGHLERNRQTKTPNLDRLALMGTTFVHAYCAAPVCNPSRTALLSGMRPGATGVYGNNQDWRLIVAPERTLPSTFRRAGYYVCGSGKIFHENFVRDSDWDEYKHPKGEPKPAQPVGVPPLQGFGPVDAPEEKWADTKSVDYGISKLQQRHDKPFFVAVGLHKPHMPWNVPRKYYDLHPLESIELPPYREDDLADLPAAGVEMARPEEHEAIVKAGQWKQAIQGYLAAISFCDAQVGRLIDALQKSEHRESTIVVLWGDHGWNLGEKHHWRKFALWEETTRAPLVWVVPGVTKPGTRCERTVDFMSIYPTLCDLCAIDTPKHVQGTSIRTLLADPTSTWERPAITTHGHNNHAVRSEGWRYIRYADGGEELYNETADPFEWTNLAGDASYSKTKAELARQLPTENKSPVPKANRPAAAN